MLINPHFPGKRCKKLLILTDIEEKKVTKGFQKNRIGGYFDVSTALGSRTFQRFFTLGCAEMSSSGRDNDKFGDGVVTTSCNKGESRHSRDEHFRSDKPQDE